MLLMELPNEHLLIFNQYKDAKTLFAAIHARFGGNDATKKTQKTLLKQMYENFSAPSTESLDFIFNRLQKIISQLAILGENISLEVLNLKFLRSLPSEWNTYVVVWRNKPDLDTMSFDDLYNNFKIVEQEVKGTASSSSSFNTANTLVSTASTQDLEQIHKDDVEEMDLKWQLALPSMRTRKFFQKTGRKITINGSDTAGYDKLKVECFNCHKLGHFARECRGPKNHDNRSRNQDSSRRTINMKKSLQTWLLWVFQTLSLDKLIGSQIPDKSRKGLGFVSYNVVLPLPTGLFSPPNLDLSNSSLEEFQQPEFEGYGPKTSKSVRKDTYNEVRESSNASLVEELVLNDKSQIPRGNQRNWNNQKSQQLGSDFVMYNKACFVCGSFDHVQANYNYHQRERVVSGNNYTRVNYNYSAKKAHPSAHRNIVPRAVLMKTGLRLPNTARPVNTAHPKTTVYSARTMSCFSKSTQSTVKRPKAVNTAMPNSAVVNVVRANHVNAIKARACWVWRPTKLNSASITFKRHNYGHPQKENQGYVYSGCSRHITGNMSYLSDFKEFDRGYVTFGGGAKGGRITSKGTLKITKLDFEDVYFVKELQFNLFSVSQMCDKKNSALFNNTACFVLSPDFKLTDESQVLLKVPRKNNMYSVDMKNSVPKESLTCLVAKAILDESILWHRRLGHVNFKTINKLVKDNRVKGLLVVAILYT
ncbi:ribonuclease H-like domain-containing protein [Tanacetum coccineum]